MADKLTRLIHESIQLELNVSELYMLFHEKIPEDSDFWWTLVLEEKHHASLLESFLETLSRYEPGSSMMSSTRLDDLKSTNKDLRKLIRAFEYKPPGRSLALNTALRIEKAAGEVHYQNFMSAEKESRVDQVLQKLNEDDKDHAERILAYMKQHNIEVQS